MTNDRPNRRKSDPTPLGHGPSKRGKGRRQPLVYLKPQTELGVETRGLDSPLLVGAPLNPLRDEGITSVTRQRFGRQ